MKIEVQAQQNPEVPPLVITLTLSPKEVRLLEQLIDLGFDWYKAEEAGCGHSDEWINLSSELGRYLDKTGNPHYDLVERAGARAAHPFKFNETKE